LSPHGRILHVFEADAPCPIIRIGPDRISDLQRKTVRVTLFVELRVTLFKRSPEES
jgi:hypothetical protein